jgi:hypothetical protein
LDTGTERAEALLEQLASNEATDIQLTATTAVRLNIFVTVGELPSLGDRCSCKSQGTRRRIVPEFGR